MFVIWPFVALLSRYLAKRGVSCECRIDGHVGTFALGQKGSATCTMVFANRSSLMLLALCPHLMMFAWLYLNQKVDGEGDWMAFARIVNKLSVKRPPSFLEKLLARSPLSQKTHYDWSALAYACFLDHPYLQYTCGRLENGDSITLEEAQLRKFRYIAQKLKPKRGERHLDCGCGWGGLIRYLTETHGTTSHGITISPEQAIFAREHTPSDLAQFFVTSFEGHVPAEPYDFATVVGMLEHVPVARHGEFFQWLSVRLRKGGCVYLQCITAAETPTDRVRLLNQHVFEHELNWINNIMGLARAAGFKLCVMEEGHKDYAFTTWEWVKRIRARKDEILQHLNGDVRVYRILLGYLTLASLACADERMHLHRILLMKE